MKITLCGSTKFMDQFNAANVAFTLAGHIVYSVATPSSGDHPELIRDQKIALDAVHLKKIMESDAILVVGRQPDGTTYIGDSTRREIMFAQIFEKEIFFYDPKEKVGGPVRSFEAEIEEALKTDAMREAEREARQKESSDIFQNNGGYQDCKTEEITK